MKLAVAPFLVVALSGAVFAQSRGRGAAPDVAFSGASVLGLGWTALGAQQPARALQFARQLLQRSPDSHEAIGLAIAALTATRQPIAGLDEYEKWLTPAGQEDLFLLRPIASALLWQHAQSQEPRIRFAALAALAEEHDADARRQLDEAARDLRIPSDIDGELAATGDQAAVARLEAQVSRGGRSDKSGAIDALAKANARGSVAVIMGALKDQAPPSRLAAANALADLEAVEAIPALREALNDPEPPVRSMAAVALARLGDPNSRMTLRDLEGSPIGEFRLVAALAAAKQDPDGPWDERVEPMLRDPDPMLRVEAARTLLEHGRQIDAARAALEAALADESPGVRTAAARTLRPLDRRNTVRDLPLLRRLLRDRLPEVQIEAARALGFRGGSTAR